MIAAKEMEPQIVTTLQNMCFVPKETDTRMLLQVKDAVNQGYTTVSVFTDGTDDVILTVTTAQRLNIDR